MVSEIFQQSYDAARQRAVTFPRQEHAWIVVSGKDRASYLQGLLTNDITVLTQGQGCYAAYLTPQGRMISDLTLYELGDVLLVALPRETRDAVLGKFDQFIFSEDVQLGDVSATFAGVSAIGPLAHDVVGTALGVDADTLHALPAYGNLRTTFQGATCILLRVMDRGEQAFDVLVERPLLEALEAALHQAGAAPAVAEAIESLRLEAGIPRFGDDMDTDIIPLEAGIESRAISFSKGCYVGQEVIIRVLHRGHGRVAKKLVGLSLAGEQPPGAGAEVQAADGRNIGAVRSAGWSPRLSAPIALAYVHRDFIASGTGVQVDGRHAVVSALPFHQ